MAQVKIPKPKKVKIGAVIQGRGVSTATAASPHGYQALSNLGIYTPDVNTNQGTDFFHYNINQPTTINTITNKALGDTGTIILKYTTPAHAITWDPEYWFPSGPVALETDKDAWNVFDYKVIQANKICMEFVASCPGTVVVAHNFYSEFTVSAASRFFFDDFETTTGVELSNDAGATWSTHTGTDIDLPAAGDYIVRKQDGAVNVRYGAVSTDADKYTAISVTSVGATSCISMFSGCQNLPSIDLSNIDFSTITIGTGMFTFCYSITSIDLTPMATAQWTNISSMFSSMTGLTSIDVSMLDTSQVDKFGYTFGNCNSLTDLDFSAWDMGNATDIQSMIYTCTSLLTITVPVISTSTCTNFSNFAKDCSKLTQANISSIDTHSATLMHGMFDGCTAMTYVLLGPNFYVGNSNGVGNMFKNCTSLVCIDQLDTAPKPWTNDLFLNCTSLVQPDATAQADLTDASGATWVNANPCP